MANDMHVVIEARKAPEDGWQYRVIVPAADWRTAQDAWTQLDDERTFRRHPMHEHFYMVRDEDDHDWAWLERPKVRRDTSSRRGIEKAARDYAKLHGYIGDGGGWIRDARGRTVGQGWGTFAARLQSQGLIRQTAGGGWFAVPALAYPLGEPS
jgi:hypothetical protein